MKLRARTVERRAEANKRVFDAPGVAERYSGFWGDRGEITALLQVADATRGQPVLDIGVGAGRTTWFLRLLSARYTGVDFAESMVAKCRENFPGYDIRVGDARAMPEFDDDTFALTFFSNNGLDAVGHEDRALALGEMARVTRPGGAVVYSTHNRYGSSFAETPWQLHRPYEPWSPSPRSALSMLLHAPSRLAALRNRYRNYTRTRSQLVAHEEWAMAPLRAHDFQLVTHFVSVAGIVGELRAAGLDLVGIYSMEGAEIDPTDGTTHTHYFHVIARKPGRGEQA
jgi:ubiquinone/menaquinone biosynthesis C-methylase UbiE